MRCVEISAGSVPLAARSPRQYRSVGPVHHYAGPPARAPHLERIHRPEAGAEILGATPIGHWLLRSKLDRPYRPHHPTRSSQARSSLVRPRWWASLAIPRPRAAREVRVSALSDVVAAFGLDGRDDLAELYLLASQLTA